MPAHPFLKRRVFYAHRDLGELLDLYEKGEKFYLYTGAGQCSALRVGAITVTCSESCATPQPRRSCSIMRARNGNNKHHMQTKCGLLLLQDVARRQRRYI